MTLFPATDAMADAAREPSSELSTLARADSGVPSDVAALVREQTLEVDLVTVVFREVPAMTRRVMHAAHSANAIDQTAIEGTHSTTTETSSAIAEIPSAAVVGRRPSAPSDFGRDALCCGGPVRRSRCVDAT